MKMAYKFSYPASAAMVDFGGFLSFLSDLQLDRKPDAVRPCV